MKKTSATIILGMCASGLLAGYAANRQTSGAARAESPASVSKAEKRSSRGTAAERNSVTAQLPKIHSVETLETMTAQGEDATYAGLALWLVDASERDIAAYWDSRKNGKLNGAMKSLIFYNWTRLDPQAAIAAVAGTDSATTPWAAWASQDPQAALSAATAAGKGAKQISGIANNIGQFQPEWLREHFDRIPKDVQSDALNGLMNWKEDGDHVATMDFLRQHGIDFHSNLFKTFARKDPWAAYDWLEKNGKLELRDGGPVDTLLDAMKAANPDDLERLAAMTPSGALQRKIEDALFSNLLATDPDAAMARAKATEAPLMAARRLAEIGASLLASDPEKAFGIGADILAVSPNKFGPEIRIDTGKNGSSWSDEDSTAEKFMESLLIKDPARTLEMSTAGNQTVTQPFRNLCAKWAGRDLGAYTDWVNLQTDSRIRNAAVSPVVSQLSSQGQFQVAAEWAMSGENPDTGNLYSLAWQWARSNPAEAAAWLDAADLPESVKAGLRPLVNRNK